jgi:pyruvate/2-oxoglutarate dehydrogenase complex dihydrolipoamide dehydrogenase (E3) component
VSAERYDAIVIGAGQSGGPLTSALTANGLKTALIERNKVGGSCVNWGCTPTKTMVGSARVAHLVQRAADYGVKTCGFDLDLSVVRQRKRDIVDLFHGGTKDAIESTDGLELIKGDASFTSEKRIRIRLAGGGTRDLTAEKIFINTGLTPSIPAIEGLDDVAYLTSASIMELGEVPEHLIIAGGGYIGLEFGQMFRRFGAQVTILSRSERLLSNEDPDISEEIQDILVEEGTVVHPSTSLTSVSHDGSGKITACADRQGRES